VRQLGWPIANAQLSLNPYVRGDSTFDPVWATSVNQGFVAFVVLLVLLVLFLASFIVGPIPLIAGALIVISWILARYVTRHRPP
jgi:hypothetical protein